MKESTETPMAIDENAPTGPGEAVTQGPDGPIKTKIDMTKGTANVDMGLKGKMRMAPNAANGTIHIEFSMVTIGGLADLLITPALRPVRRNFRAVRLSTRPSGIKGNYEASLDISI